MMRNFQISEMNRQYNKYYNLTWTGGAETVDLQSAQLVPYSGNATYDGLVAANAQHAPQASASSDIRERPMPRGPSRAPSTSGTGVNVSASSSTPSASSTAAAGSAAAANLLFLVESPA